MYSNAKSRIVHNNKRSDMFAREIVARQGENRSPLLFSIYLTDFNLFDRFARFFRRAKYKRN